MKILAIWADYDGNCLLLREDYSFADVSTRKVFDQVVKGVNKFTGNLSFVHDYERGGIARIDFPEQGRARIFPSYAEYIRIAGDSLISLLNDYYEHAEDNWQDAFQPVAAAYYELLSGDHLPSHTQKTVKFHYKDAQVLEMFLTWTGHQRTYIKRHNVPSKAVFAPKRKIFKVRFSMNKILKIDLSEAFQPESLALAS